VRGQRATRPDAGTALLVALDDAVRQGLLRRAGEIRAEEYHLTEKGRSAVGRARATERTRRAVRAPAETIPFSEKVRSRTTPRARRKTAP
jgi:DNA-binding PadR family transcriptional regulator